jgi:hypothetical protein
VEVDVLLTGERGGGRRLWPNEEPVGSGKAKDEVTCCCCG